MDVFTSVEIRTSVLPQCDNSICDLAPCIGLKWDNKFYVFERLDLVKCAVEAIVRRMASAAPAHCDRYAQTAAKRILPGPGVTGVAALLRSLV